VLIASFVEEGAAGYTRPLRGHWPAAVIFSGPTRGSEGRGHRRTRAGAVAATRRPIQAGAPAGRDGPTSYSTGRSQRKKQGPPPPPGARAEWEFLGRSILCGERKENKSCGKGAAQIRR